MTLGRVIEWTRAADRRLQRKLWPERRRVLVNVRTPMNYATMAPIIERMQGDSRIEFYFTSSETPGRIEEFIVEARQPFQLITPSRAVLTRFDAYLAADFLWIGLPRGTQRIQTFHGVAGKYRRIYDSPTGSMKGWDRLFFINRRRLQNFIEIGAIDPDSKAARLIGMPKLDCLVDGSLNRERILLLLGIDPARRTVMYAPTWSRYSSLGLMGRELVEQLGAAGFAVIAKLHDRSRDTQFVNSGGLDWGKQLKPSLLKYGGVLVDGSNSSNYLPAADILITDHSSVGFEFLLLDRPLVRIHIPELIQRTEIAAEYVDLLASASTPVLNLEQVLASVERGFAEPLVGSETRRAVAAEMFYQPGTATARAVAELYDVIELDPP